MRCVIRVDDAGWTHEESARPPIKKPDPGLRLAQRFHAAMGGLPYLAGVIGAAIDEDGAAWLATKPTGLIPAVHGWDHGAKKPAERDEFYGKVGAEVRDRIAATRRVIGPTPHLIPPYNAASDELLVPAWHEGIRYVWGQESAWPTPPQPYRRGPMWFVPAWAPLYGGSTFRQGAAPSILDTVESGVLDLPGTAVATLHIPWEAARHPDFDGVKRLVERLHSHALHPDEFVAEACP